MPANLGWVHRGVAYWRDGEEERIIVLTAHAFMIALDAKTGRPIEAFGDKVGHETWENDSWRVTGNTNVWAPMSADEELGYVYLPFSTPANDYYGGDRHGDNLFAETLVCVEAKTGKRVWHYQIVRHGVWDYDLPAAPNLIYVTIDGKRVKAVARPSPRS